MTPSDVQATGIRQHIAALLRGERRPSPAAPVRLADSTLATLRGARTTQIDGVSVFEIRRDFEELLPGEDAWRALCDGMGHLATKEEEEIYAGLRPAIGADPSRVAILDLETTGFWGCPIFLVGLLRVESGRLVTRQLLARDYPEEAAVLRAAATLLDESALVVTFNGKSYDVPCFAERCSMFGVKTKLRRRAHVDILHVARRRWRGEFEDCRLQTLERHVTRLTRQGDIPSAEIPAVYHDFAATGDVTRLEPILHHGRVDVITTLRLFTALAADPPAPLQPRKRKVER
ncbi:MAG: ribonuclease H-like domain-containing protein [Gemmatimonadetes bacterium]|nr:ribonuclease H-like domain-containing protein [Gemmatimonadota bacterium]